MNTNEISVDCYIGNKIRERRKLLGLSQTELARMMGLSYQQIQRYESGENTLAVTRLLQAAQILNVPPAFFYEGAPAGQAGPENQDPIIRKDRSRAYHILLVDDGAGDEVLFRSAVQLYDDRIQVHCIREPDNVMDFLEHSEKKYGKPRPDILMLDINMPKINGLDLLRTIKDTPHLSGIPIVMLTNSIYVKEVQAAYQSKASGFIQKTTDFDTYCADIKRTLDYWLQTVVLSA